LKSWVTNRLNWMDTNMPHVITGVGEVTDFTVSAFPNPFNQEISIEYTLINPATFSVQLFDSMGKVINTTSESRLQSGTYTLSIPAQQLPAGMYYYKATSGQGAPIAGKVAKM